MKHIVFSSTAAVYGMPERIPIPETEPYAPVNVYGESKVMVEKLLHWFDVIHGLRSVCLRYFNASGADPAGRAGEDHEPETHLIPLMFQREDGRTGEAIRQRLSDAGWDVHSRLHSRDGPGARAYCGGREAAGGGESKKYNVGTGHGFSVKEVLKAVERVTGKKVPLNLAPGGKAIRRCWWRIHRGCSRSWDGPRRFGVDRIVETAWKWANRRA